MARTFGGATADDLTISLSLTAGVSTAQTFVHGWWYPTTLTAGRGLWSNGNVSDCQINSVTDELRIIVDGSTTDGEWTTTGVDLAVNNWYFLAFLLSANNTGPADAIRVWRGTPETAPVECTVANAVALAGTHPGSASFTFGNRGTGTVAFQGSIAHAGFICAQMSDESCTPFLIATPGTITNAEAEYCYDRYVQRAWLGYYDWMAGIQLRSDAPGHVVDRGYCDMNSPAAGEVVYRNPGNVGSAQGIWVSRPTLNGTSLATVPNPREVWVPGPEYVRR